ERTDPSGQRPCEKDSQWYGDHQRDECRHRGEDDVLLESRADRPDVERALLDRVELPALHIEEEPEADETEDHRNREIAHPRPSTCSGGGLGDHARSGPVLGGSLTHDHVSDRPTPGQSACPDAIEAEGVDVNSLRASATAELRIVRIDSLTWSMSTTP